MGEVTKTFEQAVHPLQRAWDTALIEAWRDQLRVQQLRERFSAQHMGGTPVTKASGLRRLPMDDEIEVMPVTVWMNEAGLGRISEALLKHNLHKPNIPVPQGLLDRLEHGTLDCNMTAVEGKRRNDQLRDLQRGKNVRSVAQGGQAYRTYKKTNDKPSNT